MTARTLTACALFVALGAALAQPPKLADPPPAAPKAGEKPDLNKRLAARINLDRQEGKFREVVATVAEVHDLPLVLTRAVEQGTISGSDDAEQRRGDTTVRLPRLTNVKAETVLSLLCEQADAKFLVYPDHIRIVPDTFAAYESGVLTPGAEANGEDAPLLTQPDLLRAKPLTRRGLVNASFKGTPLVEVLDAIAEQTGANVVLSPTLPTQVRQMPVTVRFANAPVDAAVRTLCEMTEAGVIGDANVLVVTTRERATARAKEEAQRLKDKQAAPLAGPGLCGGPFHPPADPTAELAKMKERNDQLAKQLDALTKQLDELKKK